jgi:hypothetical protein
MATLAVALLLLASGAASASLVSATGWKTFRATNGKFTISAPSSWVDFTRSTPAALKAAEADPSLRPYLEVVKKQKAMKLVLVDLHGPTLKSRFATNLNVIQIATPGTLEQLRKLELEKLKSVNVVVGAIDASYVKLPAGQALRVAYHARFSTSTPTVAITQFIFVRGGVETVITYSTLPSAEGTYRPTFEQSARKFRFL